MWKDRQMDSRAFGFGCEEPDDYLLADPEDEEADVVEESDVFNSETFGSTAAVEEEWDIELLSQHTESLNNLALDAHGINADVGRISGNVASASLPGDWYRNFEQSFEEMMEKSLRDLVSEDDDPSASMTNENRTSTAPSGNATQLSGSFVQNPFLQVSPQTKNIWELSAARQFQALDSDGPKPADPLQVLLSKLELSAARKPATDRPPDFRPAPEAARTVQQLEAELKATRPRLDDAPLQSRARQQASIAGMPSHHIPPPPAPWMFNPQLRAAVLACVAAGKPLPPGIAPPPFPMPVVGFGPRFNPAAPSYGSESMPNPDGGRFKYRPIQPLHRSPFSQRGGIRSPFWHGRSFLARPPAMGQQPRSLFDDYAGLMTRRERDWLLKIQALQVHCDDPLNEDYYWTMYQTKKRIKKLNDSDNAKSDSVANISSDSTDVQEILEPRAYVPPIFEGSLGKVQCSSINSPRQVLDLQTAEQSSESAPSAKSRCRQFAALLLDIENAFLLVLDCERLVLETGDACLTGRTGQQSELIASRVRLILNLICTDAKKLRNVLVSKKGRHLILKVLPLLQDVELVIMLRQFMDLLMQKQTAYFDESFAAIIGWMESTTSPHRDWVFIADTLLEDWRPDPASPPSVYVDALLTALLHCCEKCGMSFKRGIVDAVSGLADCLAAEGEASDQRDLTERARGLRYHLNRAAENEHPDQDGGFMKLL